MPADRPPYPVATRGFGCRACSGLPGEIGPCGIAVQELGKVGQAFQPDIAREESGWKA